MDNFIGEIRLFAGNYAPVDWALCNGQMLSIANYNALFALFGTTWGGDGVNDFGVPDLRGRVPIHYGQGTGLQNYPLATSTGQETVALTTSTLPSHTHAWQASAAQATALSPSNSVLATVASGQTLYELASTYSKPWAAPSDTVGTTGGNQAHANMMPFLVLNFIVALTGIFPSRN